MILRKNPKLHIANSSATSVMVQVGQILGIGHNPYSWFDRIGKYSPENQQKIYVHAKVVRTLAEDRTPSLGLGFPKRVTTVVSEVKDLLPTWKVDLEEEDVHSEPPLEGGPKVAELPAEKRKEIQDVIIK